MGASRHTAEPIGRFVARGWPRISFVGWMMVGVPIMLASMLFLTVWLLVPHARGVALNEHTVTVMARNERVSVH
jgi:hypothetical protein